MTFALLSHGGAAGFNPRIRIPGGGAWDWFQATELLNTEGDLIEFDLSGKRKGEIGESYGVGRHGKQCLLVFRQLQEWEQNRSREYPYTLLLDVGDEVWRRLSWNAVLLAGFLAEGPEGAVVGGTLQPIESVDRIRQDRFLLLRSPEGIADENVLRDICQRVVAAVLSPEGQPHESRPVPEEADGSIDRLRQIWVGSLIEESMVELPISLIGIERRPDPHTLVKVLAPLPPCLKVGRGWLFGLPALARAVGAHLVVTEAPCKTSRETVERITTAGRHLLEGWQAASIHPETSVLMARLGEIPLWEWGERDVPSFLENIRVLGALRTADEWVGEAEKTIASGVYHDEELKLPFHESLDILIAKSRAPLGPAGTRYVLRGLPSEEALLAYGAAILGRLHRETFLEELVRTGFPKGWRDEELINAIPSDVLSQVWQKRMVGAFPEEILSLVEEALSLPFGPKEANLEEFIERALERVCEEDLGRRRNINDLLTKLQDRRLDFERIAHFLIGQEARRDVSLENMKRFSSYDGWRALACLNVVSRGTKPADEGLDPRGIVAEDIDYDRRFSAFWEDARRLASQMRRSGKEAEFRRFFRKVFGIEVGYAEGSIAWRQSETLTPWPVTNGKIHVTKKRVSRSPGHPEGTPEGGYFKKVWRSIKYFLSREKD